MEETSEGTFHPEPGSKSYKLAQPWGLQYWYDLVSLAVTEPSDPRDVHGPVTAPHGGFFLTL